MNATDFHPWRDIKGANENKLGSVKVRLNFPPTITTEGGIKEFDLRYTCRKDLCSGNSHESLVITSTVSRVLIIPSIILF